MVARARLADDEGMANASKQDRIDPGTVDMRTVVAELRTDHRNMAILLGLLRREILTARRGGDPDFDLLTDIMHYLTYYADAVHHPREDLVYEKLDAAGQGNGLIFVESDHAELAADGKQLRDEVEAAISGAALAREKFVIDAMRYVERLEEHMRWEESDLFLRADGMGDETVELGPLAVSDPVFGQDTSARYASLLAHIRDAASG